MLLILMNMYMSTLGEKEVEQEVIRKSAGNGAGLPCTLGTGSTSIALLVAILGSHCVARFRFKERVALKTAILTNQVFSVAALIGSLFMMLVASGLINTYLWSILTLTLSVWMSTSYFAKIAGKTEECAQLDGPSSWWTLFTIVVPVSTPGIVATTIYCVVTAWNEIIFTLSFAQDTSVKTLPTALAEFTKQFETDWRLLTVASVITTLPIIAVFFSTTTPFHCGTVESIRQIACLEFRETEEAA